MTRLFFFFVLPSEAVESLVYALVFPFPGWVEQKLRGTEIVEACLSTILLKLGQGVYGSHPTWQKLSHLVQIAI